MSTIYKQGDHGAVVKQIQKVVGAYPDGLWGPVTTECVKAWQRAHKLTPDGLAGAATLAAMGITAAVNAVTPSLGHSGIQRHDVYLKKSRRRIDWIAVHCTATPEGQAKTVEQLRREHVAQGWSDIGYHYVVTLDGQVHEGRDVDIAGSHVSGYNANSIGVVYVGGLENDPRKKYSELKPKDTRTNAQKAALMSLLIDLRKLYPKAVIQGHRNFPKVSKDCPSFDAAGEYQEL